MTPDIKRMAIEAGMPGFPRRLAKFAAMVAELCAKEAHAADIADGLPDSPLYCSHAANRIRAKFPVPVFVPGRKKVPKKPSATVVAKRVAKVDRNDQIVWRIMAGEKRSAIACEFKVTAQTVGDIAKRAGIAPGTRFTRE